MDVQGSKNRLCSLGGRVGGIAYILCLINHSDTSQLQASIHVHGRDRQELAGGRELAIYLLLLFTDYTALSGEGLAGFFCHEADGPKQVQVFRFY